MLAACLLLAVAGLGGCSGRGPAPVAERSVADVPASGVHRVRAGETLYSIAWRYGIDWQTLARRNGIGAPWLIRPGEDLRVAGTGSSATAASRTAASTAGRPSTGAGRAHSPSVLVSDPPPASRPAATSRNEARAAPAAPGSSSPARWSWPLEGELLQEFSASGNAPNKGIDIRGASGATVRVAAPGEVVYSGSGLRGYRQLVIVKHDANWLSAYAHNSRSSLVREGQQLTAGAAVARVDGEPHQRVLHFEIRRDGTPVDPVAVLPRR